VNADGNFIDFDLASTLEQRSLCLPYTLSDTLHLHVPVADIIIASSLFRSFYLN